MGNSQAALSKTTSSHDDDGELALSSSSPERKKKRMKPRVLRVLAGNFFLHKKKKNQNHPQDSSSHRDSKKKNTNNNSSSSSHHRDELSPYAASTVSVLSLSSLPATFGALKQLSLTNQQEQQQPIDDISSPNNNNNNTHHYHYLPNTPRIVRTCYDDLKLNQAGRMEHQVQSLKRAAYHSQSCLALPLGAAWDHDLDTASMMEHIPITPSAGFFFDDEFIMEPTSPMTMTRFVQNILSDDHQNNNNNKNRKMDEGVRDDPHTPVTVMKKNQSVKPLTSPTEITSVTSTSNKSRQHQQHSRSMRSLQSATSLCANSSTTNLSQYNTSNTNLSQFNVSTSNLRMNENGEWEDDETYSCSSSQSSHNDNNNNDDESSMSDFSQHEDEEDYIDQFINGETTEVKLSSSIAYLKNSFIRSNAIVI
ncbi:hypothetical protein FDP41_001220 [Naegleria fowleri]|uniref:Uncharacterized protein n=1 Tax=Naegleria fowleri TaxID=5763 RepID=A0A6A5BSA3_NAEFO|nr:uncharacterized protein FDP41_001220 [Naegleria fowleri]KAF0980067.1 hypothetical protein FDP41_001220 [Naegleria fowleri]